jgi:hypothetical protein
MDDGERLHRRDPVRSAPIRDLATAFRDGDSWGKGAPNGTAAADGDSCDGSLGDVISSGVALAYRVINDQIRQGQRVAEQLSDQYYPPGAGRDAMEVGEKLVQASTEAWRVWLDFLTKLFGGADFPGNLPAAWSSVLPAVAAAPPQRPPAVSVEVSAARPTRVTLELRPKAAGRPLATFDLRSVEATKPPLTDVTFECGLPGEIVGVRIRIPNGQPPGTYTGVVVDRDTGDSLGTMSVRIA